MERGEERGSRRRRAKVRERKEREIEVKKVGEKIENICRFSSRLAPHKTKFQQIYLETI